MNDVNGGKGDGENICESNGNNLDGFTKDINTLQFRLSGLRGGGELSELQKNDYNKDYLLELINEVDSIENLEGQELNRYFFLVIEYLTEISEENPVKAEKTFSLLKRLSETNKGLNFTWYAIIIQHEIQKFFYNGNYTKISENFDSYINFINGIFADFDENNIEINGEKILKLDLLTFLIINLSLCIFDKKNQEMVMKLGEKLLLFLDSFGMGKHLLLIKQSIINSQLNTELKPSINIKEIENIEKDINKIDETDYAINLQKITSKEKYQFLILKLEVMIEGDIEDSEIEFLIKKIENQDEEDFDLKIHFDYLKAFYHIKKGKSTKNTVEETRDKANNLIMGEGIQEKDETRKGIEMLEKIIDDNMTIENKLFLFKTLVLLIEKEEEIFKKIEYYFNALKYVKKHFGEKSNFYMDELLDIGKKIFPTFDEERINLEYRLFTYEKNEERDDLSISKQLEEDTSYDHLAELLKDHFGVVELFIHEISGEDIRYSNGFNEEVGGNHGNGILTKEEILAQVNEQEWSKIQVTENSIPAILNSDYFSETLTGKIITIGKHKKILVCLGKGSKNNTCLTKKQLRRIEFQYLRKKLSDDIANADSERKIKIEKLYEELQKLMETIEKMSGEVFHDMNNQLFAIGGNMGFVEDDIVDFSKGDIDEEKFIKSMKKSLKIILPAIDILQKLCKDGARTLQSKGDFIINKKETNVNKLIKNICDSYNPMIKKSGKNIEIISDIDEEIIIGLDDTQFSRVINNLLHNSIKFIEESGIIKISTYIKNNNFNLIVADDGIGIDKKDLKTIFIYGEQSGSEQNKLKGTGKGLSSCKKIVLGHNGTIYAISDGKKGSTFHIQIPIKNTILQNK